MSNAIILIGAGGHASVLADMLLESGHVIAGIVSIISAKRVDLATITRYATDEEFMKKCKPNEVTLVNGLGSLPVSTTRFDLHKKFKEAGYTFMQVVSPTAIISRHATLDEGAQVMPGAIINSGTNIGACSIINTGAIVDHDCQIGPYNHIAPGAVLSGGIHTGEYVHVGTGAVIIQGVTIGSYSVVGAGACVSKNIGANKIVYPAKPFITGRQTP